MIKNKEIDYSKGYNRHIEFFKEQQNQNPNTGEVKRNTIIDTYIYDNGLELMGWGTYDKFMESDKFSVDELTNKLIEVMEKDNFSITYDEVRDKNGNMKNNLKPQEEDQNENDFDLEM